MKKKYIPNALSIFRLSTVWILLPVAYFKKDILFTVLYCLIGFTDALDGFLARKYHWESEFGAKIDNLGDTGLFVCAFVSLIFLRKPTFEDPVKCIATLFVGVALKVFIFTLTKIRFGEFNTMHTYSNKALGLVMFSFVPICFLRGEVAFGTVLFVVACAALTVLEDAYILLKSETYNVDHKGLLGEKLSARRRPAA
ncbi:MAG: CDP-alcohol phosphatidyltransferase family protein [Oscillospiraceae bacterium]|nr:CDP-alcohol phosphatidyltransferase family protein [Oscillospiraceae bacterium]